METWVHLFCINSLASGTTALGLIRNSSAAVVRIQSAVESAAEVVKEAQRIQGKEIRCETCGSKEKGDLVQCKGNCGRFFHRLCLQIDCLDIIGWEAKKEHLCLRCRDLDHVSFPDDKNEVAPPLDVTSSTSLAGSTKANTSAGRAESNGEEVEQYFDRKTGKKPLKTEGERIDFVVPSQEECIAEVESLHRQSNVDQAFDTFELQYQQQFSEWSFSMATSQSILLYGLGSKTTMLTSFGQHLSSEGDVVSLNGYDPKIDLNRFLEYMDLLFCDGSGPTQINPHSSMAKNNIAVRDSNKGLAKKAASIAKMFASKRSRPLFVLIHNIDGVGLRNRFAQDAIATLTTNSRKDGSPMIRIVASVDNVNSAMVLWSPQVVHKFDWAWKKVHTYRPYLEEVKGLPNTESSKKVKKNKGNQKPGAATAILKVLAYLAPRHTEVLQGLAALQLSNSSNSVSYNILRDDCMKKMLTSSDTQLRNIIKELSDHNMMGSEKDDEGIEQTFIPSTIPLQDILDWKLNQPTF